MVDLGYFLDLIISEILYIINNNHKNKNGKNIR